MRISDEIQRIMRISRNSATKLQSARSRRVEYPGLKTSSSNLRAHAAAPEGSSLDPARSREIKYALVISPTMTTKQNAKKLLLVLASDPLCPAADPAPKSNRTSKLVDSLKRISIVSRYRTDNPQ